MGKGRFGADEIQRAAIQEQRQDAAENPIAATLAAAAANGASSQSQSNIENLLDIDFDGAAPASHEQSGSVSATPDRVASPAVGAAGPSGGMADMMGLFDSSSPVATSSQQPPMGSAMGDIMNGFASMDITGTSAPPPPHQQLHPQGTGGQPPQGQSSGSAGDDLLGLF